MKFVAIAGTNKTGSTNRMLIEFIRSRYSYKADIEVLDISGLPVYSKVPEPEVPQRVLDLAQAVSSSDGVIISTPEYDHSVPAVLMNALEWLSYGIHPFYNKPVLIVGLLSAPLGLRAHSYICAVCWMPPSFMLSSCPVRNSWLTIRCRLLMIMVSLRIGN